MLRHISKMHTAAAQCRGPHRHAAPLAVLPVFFSFLCLFLTDPCSVCFAWSFPLQVPVPSVARTLQVSFYTTCFFNNDSSHSCLLPFIFILNTQNPFELEPSYLTPSPSLMVRPCQTFTPNGCH